LPSTTKHGVEEYYVYDPDENKLLVYVAAS